jgi:hypothetical protein
MSDNQEPICINNQEDRISGNMPIIQVYHLATYLCDFQTVGPAQKLSSMKILHHFLNDTSWLKRTGVDVFMMRLEHGRGNSGFHNYTPENVDQTHSRLMMRQGYVVPCTER